MYMEASKHIVVKCQMISISGSLLLLLYANLDIIDVLLMFSRKKYRERQFFEIQRIFVCSSPGISYCAQHLLKKYHKLHKLKDFLKVARYLFIKNKRYKSGKKHKVKASTNCF